MSQFHVDLHALQEAAAGIRGIVDRVEHADLKDVPHDARTVGHDGLAKELGKFADLGTDWLKMLADDSEGVASGLSRCAQDYIRCEEHLQGQIHGIIRGTGHDPAAGEIE